MGKRRCLNVALLLLLHRLATELGAPLPNLLIVDSPMKTISERENREQFQGFYEMLYALKIEELSGTQIIVIDKEFSAPHSSLRIEIQSRHMRPGDRENPPLIPYYDGK